MNKLDFVVFVIEQLSSTKGMVVFLSVMACIFMWGLVRSSRDKANTFKIVDFVLGDDGKASNIKVVLMISFFLSCWIMVYLTLNKLMTEGYFTIFSAVYASPAVVKIFKGSSPGTTETTTISSVVNVVPKKEP